MFGALSDEGYALAVAAHGGEAPAPLATFRPRTILLDLRMPVLDGRAFARAYLARPDADARLPIMTAEPVAARDLADLLRKPFDLDPALAALGRWVRAHAITPDRVRHNVDTAGEVQRGMTALGLDGTVGATLGTGFLACEGGGARVPTATSNRAGPGTDGAGRTSGVSEWQRLPADPR